jgi:hypothetical protein
MLEKIKNFTTPNKHISKAYELYVKEILKKVKWGVGVRPILNCHKHESWKEQHSQKPCFMTAKPSKQQPINVMRFACIFTPISHLNKATQLNQSFSNVLLQADLAFVKYGLV